MTPFGPLFVEDFYAGPETGLGLTENGELCAFIAIDESTSRLQRAYVLRRLPSLDAAVWKTPEWAPIGAELAAALAQPPSAPWIFTKHDLMTLIVEVAEPPHALMVGDSWLKQVQIAAVPTRELDAIRKLPTPRAWRRAHRWVTRTLGGLPA